MERVREIIARIEASAGPDPLDRVELGAWEADELVAVADGVLDHFVGVAREQGYSWADIGARLGVTKQAVQQRFVPGKTRVTKGLGPRLGRLFSSGGGAMKRFAPAGEDIITRGQELAVTMRHGYLGTEHLVLAAAELPGIARALDGLGVDPPGLRGAVLELVGEGSSEPPPAAKIPLTRRCRRGLTLALRECLLEGSDRIEPRHVLLGAVAVEGGVAARIFEAAGVSLDRARTALAEDGPAR